MRLFFALTCLFYFSFDLLAQQVSFTAVCAYTEVSVGEPFEISFIVDNTEIRDIKFPDFFKAGFEKAGYNTSSSFQSINGRSSSSESYIFTLIPRKTGQLVIEPAKIITSKGKVLYSKPIVLNAVKAKTTKNKTNGSFDETKVLFRLVPSKQTAFVGESILLDFKMYTQIDLMNIELVKEPDFGDFYVHPMPYIDQGTKIEIVNGKQYASKILYRVNVFPKKTGILELDPAEVEIYMGSGSALNPFASSKAIRLPSDKLKIEVKSIKNAPKSFGGAIGNFRMETFIDKTEISTDEAVKIKLMISGMGDIKQIAAPKILFGEGQNDAFEIFPPKIKEDLRQNEMGLGGIKEFDYTLNPQELGEIILKPSFSYFDVNANRFITLDTVFKVKVIQGKRKLGPKKINLEDDPSEKTLQFSSIDKMTVWKKSSKPLFGSGLFWFISLLPFLLLLLFWMSRKIFEKRLEIIAAKREKSKAEKMALAKLKEAEKFMKQSKSAEFYEAISDALKNYLSAKFRIPKGSVNKDVLKLKLQESGFEEYHIIDFLSILQQSEIALFAANTNIGAMEETYRKGEELLNVFINKLS